VARTARIDATVPRTIGHERERERDREILSALGSIRSEPTEPRIGLPSAVGIGIGPYATVRERFPDPPPHGIVRIGTPTVRGTMSASTVRASLARLRGRFEWCYESAARQVPNLRGALAFRFVIGATGAVMMAVPVDPPMNPPTLGACLASAIRTLEYPHPPGGGIVIVTLPLDVRPAPRSAGH
jgi:hypothetical protein